MQLEPSNIAIIICRALLTYGTGAFAGYQLASQVEEFFGAPCFGLQIATTTLLAQSLGRADAKGANAYYKQISKWGALISIPIMVILFFGAPLLMMLLTDKPNVQQVGAVYLRIAALAVIPQMLNMIDFGAIRVTSSRSFPLIATVIGMWGIRVPVAALAAWVWKADIGIIFAGIALDQIVRWCVALLYRRKKHVFWHRGGCPDQKGSG